MGAHMKRTVRLFLSLTSLICSPMCLGEEMQPGGDKPTFVVSPAGVAAMNAESRHRAELAEIRRKLELRTLEAELEKAERDLNAAKNGAAGNSSGSPGGTSSGGLATLGTLPVIAPLGDSTAPSTSSKGGALLAPLPPPSVDLTPNPQLALAGIADGQAVFVVGKTKVVRTRVGEIIGGYTVDSIDTNQVILTKKDGDPNKRSRLTFTIGL